MQTYDEANRATGFYAFNGDGTVLRHERPSKGLKMYLLPDGKRLLDSEKWTYTKTHEKFPNTRKTRLVVVANGERNIRVEDHRGNLQGNEWVIGDHRDNGDLTFSGDGSICFIRGSAEDGDEGYEIYNSDGGLIADEKMTPVRGEAEQVFFSSDNRLIGFIKGENLFVFNRKGQKVFEYKFDTQVEQCGFSPDDTKIVVLSTTNLVVLGSDGKLISKTVLDGGKIRGIRFLLLGNDRIAIIDNLKIWIGNLNGQLNLVEDFGQAFIGSISGVGSNIVAGIKDKSGKHFWVLLNSNGDVLDKKEVSRLGLIKSNGDYFLIFRKEHLDIYKD